MIISEFSELTLDLINKSKPTQLILISPFNSYFPDNLPEFITQIIFGDKFTKKDSVFDFESIIYQDHIYLDDIAYSKFNNKSIKNLPDSIQFILFPQDSTFNCELVKLPENLEFLSLGKQFTKSLDNLPKGLKYLIFQPVIFTNQLNKLPQSLEYFGIKTSDDSILAKLPIQTKYLYLDLSRFVNIVLGNNQVLDNLPTKLDTLILTCKYYSKLSNLPAQLTRLDITNLSDLETLKFLPNSLTELSVGLFRSEYDLSKSDEYFSSLSPKLKKLVINGNIYSQTDTFDYKLNLTNLPNSLAWLEIKNLLIDFPIFDCMPNSVDTLIISGCCTNLVNWNILENLPNNLDRLFIRLNKSSYCLNLNIRIDLNNLPNSLTKLIVSNNFVLDVYYPNITTLILNFDYKDNKLPVQYIDNNIVEYLDSENIIRSSKFIKIEN